MTGDTQQAQSGAASASTRQAVPVGTTPRPFPQEISYIPIGEDASFVDLTHELNG